MTSLMTSRYDDKLRLIYLCLNEIATIFAITRKLFDIINNVDKIFIHRKFLNILIRTSTEI